MRSSSSLSVRALLVTVVVVSGALVAGCGWSEEDEELVAASSESLKAPPEDGFSFARSVDVREKAVPVTGGGNAWKTIYAVRLDNLGADERLAVRGEVQLTRCHISDVEKGTPCKDALPEGARLEYRARIVVGGDARNAEGRIVSETEKVNCSHFDHHCAVAIDEGIERGFSGTRYAKLVVAAEGAGKLMIVDDTHGGLTVTRMGKRADREGKAWTARRESDAWMDLDASDVREAKGLPGRKPHVTFRQRIDNALPGDILDVDARIVAITRSGGSRPGGCQGAREPLITNQVFLSAGRDPEETKVATLTAKNGTNCRLDARCAYEKSGAVPVPKDHVAGEPLYVSIVSHGGRSCAGSGDEWRVDSASNMTVRRRRGAP